MRLSKNVVQRVTVVMFEVNNRGSDGTGCFRINVRTDGAEGKMFIKRPTFVAE